MTEAAARSIAMKQKIPPRGLRRHAGAGVRPRDDRLRPSWAGVIVGMVADAVAAAPAPNSLDWGCRPVPIANAQTGPDRPRPALPC